MRAAGPPFPQAPGLTRPQQPLGGAAQAPQAQARRRVRLGTIGAGFFIAVTLVLLAGAGGSIASITYVAVAFAVGALLYARDPAGYVSFTLWLWFLTPFVRRVLDMHHGWSPTNPALLAPLAVSLLGALTVLRSLRELRGILFAPYLLVILALGYGYSVGLITAGPIPATYALFTWLAPALFGLHIGISWRRYPELASSVRRTFVWALPILAAYGVFQFVRMPVWDAQWMINADLRSIGEPRPFLARIFGTLNTPGPFAAFLCAAALTVLPTKGRLRFISLGLGMVALLLARTRAVWVAFIIGLLTQQIGQPLKRMPRYVITLVAVALVSLPVASIPQFSALIAPRLRSFANLSEDNSFVKRYNFSEQAAQAIVETAEGSGLGTTGGAIKLRGGEGVVALDNGFLEVFFIFGWPGGSLFFLGIVGLAIQSMRFRETRVDSFANAARATFVALISILPIGDVFTGPTGALLWMAVGFGIAAHGYHVATGNALRSSAWRDAIARRSVAGHPAPVPGLAMAGAERATR